MLILIYLFMFMLLTGLLGFLFNQSYVLIRLLFLEYLSVTIFFFISLIVDRIELESYIIIIYLVFCVCEGRIGLGLLILIIRFYGNNFMGRLSLLKC
jgi:NADH-ubiquinone oxidoreductase chain 4L